jgi:PIN domain nuclease of toxin-antitoxin system
MSEAPLLDTHAWIWWVDHDRRLGRAQAEALDAMPASDRPCLCDISLWEVAMLVERGRLSFTIPFAEWLESAAHPRTVRLIPVSEDIVVEVTRLPQSFHRDPADRIIVAACRVLKIPLVTTDRLILSSRLVKRWRPQVARA